MDSRTLLCTINMQYPWFMGPWAWVVFGRIPDLETKHQILLSQSSTQYNPNLNLNHNTSILGEGHPQLKNLHRIEVGASVAHFCLNTWHFCNINSQKKGVPLHPQPVSSSYIWDSEVGVEIVSGQLALTRLSKEICKTSEDGWNPMGRRQKYE